MPIQLSGSLVITGSITTTGVITMSGSIASASYSSNSDLLQGTGSVGFATTASLLEVSSSQQQISSSLLQVSSSQQQISASLLNVVANYATTGSNSFRANQSITGSLVVSSTITAQTLVVQTVTSSIVYSSGSNIFGSNISNIQTFTGSVNITGSLALAGNITSNGTAVMLGTGSANYLSKFTAASTIGNSLITDDGTTIQATRTAGDLEFGLTAGNTTTAGNPSIALYSNTGTGNLVPYGTIKVSPDAAGNTRAAKMVFATRQSGGTLTDALTINSSQNVGIGTTAPITLLQVSGSSTDNLVFVNNTNANGYASVRCANNGNKAAVFGVGGSSVGAPYANTGYIYTDEGVDLTFSIAGSQKMRITAGGTIQTYSGTTLYGEIYIAGTAMAINGYNGDLNLQTSGANRLKINSSGWIGIDRTATANRLEVNGDASKTSAGSWLANSDINIKTDINTIEGALDRINKVRLVSFKYKDAYKEANNSIKDKFYHNVIAQEFQEIYPDYVYDSGDVFEDHKVLQVDTNPMYIDSVSAIQELSKIIQEQQVTITSLQEQINELI